MVDLALQNGAARAGDVPAQSGALARLQLGDSFFRYLTRTAALLVLFLLSGIIVSLMIGSWPALRAFGPSFLFEQRWNPVTEKFGALAPIYGTLVTSLIAMLIAVPLGLFIAMFLTELCPPGCVARSDRDQAARRHSQHHLRYHRIFVFAPFLQRRCSRLSRCSVMFRCFPLFAGPPYIGMLTSGLILTRSWCTAVHHFNFARRIRSCSSGA